MFKREKERRGEGVRGEERGVRGRGKENRVRQRSDLTPPH